jgi:hypothetical protein
VADTWTGTTWFVEGDVADCFGSLDHDIMVEILADKIHDNRFLRLMRNMLQAGYLEQWRWNATLSGAPQGGVVSPILCNIYLHRWDDYVENTLIPDYTRGTRRIRNAEYERLRHRLARARKRGDRDLVRQLRRRQAGLPSVDCRDPGYRRLRYVRYADDVFGFAGPKTEAEAIKQRLTRFMRNELRLDLAQDKTLITHARTRAARFLGYEITTQTGTGGRRTAEGSIRLRVPIQVIKTSCATYLRGGKPAAQGRSAGDPHGHQQRASHPGQPDPATCSTLPKTVARSERPPGRLRSRPRHRQRRRRRRRPSAPRHPHHQRTPRRWPVHQRAVRARISSEPTTRKPFPKARDVNAHRGFDSH